MKKTVKRLTAVILTVMIALTCSMPAFAGGDEGGGSYVEITSAKAQEFYDKGVKVIIFFYIQGCPKCKNIKEGLINKWVSGGITIYAHDLNSEAVWPTFLSKYVNIYDVSTPVVAFVNGANTVCRQGATSFDVLNQDFYNLYGVKPPVNTITGVSLSQTSASLEIGDTLQLYATVSPSTANQSVTWSSSNSSVATVSSSGYVTAKASGSAYITATTADGSYSASCYVSVSECEASLESISIRTKPNKTTYTVGDTFNSAGLTLNLHYSDGSTQVATSGFTCSKPDMSTAGQKMITVSYKCYMTSFTIQVNAKPAATLSSISIRTNPSKTTYTVGESFNSSGLSLTAKYSDGSTKTITSGFTCSKPDMSTAGTKTVTVTYQGKTASFNITVKAKAPAVTVSSIEIRTTPSKLAYTVGESFNSSGLTLNVYYSDGTSKSVTSGFTCSSPDMSTAGTKTVTVTYKGKTASFNITVKAKPVTVTLSSISVKTNPSKTAYTVGESFNSSGLTLNAKYSDGSTKVITSGFTCSKPDMSTAGTKTVTVTYQGKTTSFSITVKAKTIKATSVEIVVIQDFNGTDTAKLGATVNPSNASYKSLVWSSSDPNIASVAYDGTITTHNEGTAVITVTVTNHDGTTVSDSVDVNVQAAAADQGGGIFDFFMAILELLFLPFTLLFSILFG